MGWKLIIATKKEELAIILWKWKFSVQQGSYEFVWGALGKE